MGVVATGRQFGRAIGGFVRVVLVLLFGDGLDGPLEVRRRARRDEGRRLDVAVAFRRRRQRAEGDAGVGDVLGRVVDAFDGPEVDLGKGKGQGLGDDGPHVFLVERRVVEPRRHDLNLDAGGLVGDGAVGGGLEDVVPLSADFVPRDVGEDGGEARGSLLADDGLVEGDEVDADLRLLASRRFLREDELEALVPDDDTVGADGHHRRHLRRRREAVQAAEGEVDAGAELGARHDEVAGRRAVGRRSPALGDVDRRRRDPGARQDDARVVARLFPLGLGFLLLAGADDDLGLGLELEALHVEEGPRLALVVDLVVVPAKRELETDVGLEVDPAGVVGEDVGHGNDGAPQEELAVAPAGRHDAVHDGDVDEKGVAVEVGELGRDGEFEGFHPDAVGRRPRDGDEGRRRRRAADALGEEHGRVVDLLDVRREPRGDDGVRAQDFARSDDDDPDDIQGVDGGFRLEKPLGLGFGDGDGVGERVARADLGRDGDPKLAPLALRVRGPSGGRRLRGDTQGRARRTPGSRALATAAEEALGALVDGPLLSRQSRRVLDETNPAAVPRSRIFDLVVEDDPGRHLRDADEATRGLVTRCRRRPLPEDVEADGQKRARQDAAEDEAIRREPRRHEAHATSPAQPNPLHAAVADGIARQRRHQLHRRFVVPLVVAFLQRRRVVLLIQSADVVDLHFHHHGFLIDRLIRDGRIVVHGRRSSRRSRVSTGPHRLRRDRTSALAALSNPGPLTTGPR
mmetsp:Transcript_501/g.1341  ORF Transcript_501/g.1341 Transcript_501/m.1341 type:complete len:743 (-) Transcript_501:67-2295(-)